MPKYTYRAVNDNGRPVRGVVTAANESELISILEEGGMALVDCKELSEKKGKLAALKMQKIKIRDLIQMFVQLQQLQQAGIPLLESLADVRDTSESERLRDIMSDIYREVAEGKSLSMAMSKHPIVFEPVFLALINAGEETGNLTESFGEVIKHLKWTDEMRRKIKKATRYPKILLVVIAIVIYVMLSYVVPPVTGFLLEMGRELPPVTTSLIATSDFMQAYAFYIFLGLVAFLAFLKVGRSMSKEFRYKTDSMALNAPVMGPLIRKIALSQFSRTFGVLFNSGLEILKCLETAKLTAGNMVIMESLDGVKQRVQEGSTLSESLKVSGEFPSLVIRMVRVGEESGNLTKVLNQVSEFYDRDVNDAVDAMIQMIEPSLTGVLGGMILWIAAAVFGPIYDSLGDMGA